jgi:hypothetical protein
VLVNFKEVNQSGFDIIQGRAIAKTIISLIH